jgi:hypothetical protein
LTANVVTNKDGVYDSRKMTDVFGKSFPFLSFLSRSLTMSSQHRDLEASSDLLVGVGVSAMVWHRIWRLSYWTRCETLV